MFYKHQPQSMTYLTPFFMPLKANTDVLCGFERAPTPHQLGEIVLGGERGVQGWGAHIWLHSEDPSTPAGSSSPHPAWLR